MRQKFRRDVIWGISILAGLLVAPSTGQSTQSTTSKNSASSTVATYSTQVVPNRFFIDLKVGSVFIAPVTPTTVLFQKVDGTTINIAVPSDIHSQFRTVPLQSTLTSTVSYPVSANLRVFIMSFESTSGVPSVVMGVAEAGGGSSGGVVLGMAAANTNLPSGSNFAVVSSAVAAVPIQYSSLGGGSTSSLTKAHQTGTFNNLLIPVIVGADE